MVDVVDSERLVRVKTSLLLRLGLRPGIIRQAKRDEYRLDGLCTMIETENRDTAVEYIDDAGVFDE